MSQAAIDPTVSPTPAGPPVRSDPGPEREGNPLLSGPLGWAVWALVAIAGAFGFATIAGLRGEGTQVNAIWMIVAGVSTYAIGYRFYSKWIARQVLGLDDRRAKIGRAHV